MTDSLQPSEGTERDRATPSIRLDNVLKLAGIAQTGGQAKRMIQAGEVWVNGTVETRRKHMLHEGDEVEAQGETFVVELMSEDDIENDMDDVLDDVLDEGPRRAPGAPRSAAEEDPI